MPKELLEQAGREGRQSERAPAAADARAVSRVRRRELGEGTTPFLRAAKAVDLSLMRMLLARAPIPR